MKISIVVPVYNAEKFLKECIESVLNQTNSNWELVLVDDGSTDKSAQICDSFAKEYANKIYSFHKKNEGQFLTRQYGINKSTGDYIGFLDADDLLDKSYVETILNCIENDSSVEVICFNFSEFEDDFFKEVKKLEKNQFRTKEELKVLHKQVVNGTLTGSMWSKVFKRDLINNIVVDESTVSQKKYGEDAFQSFAILLEAQNVCFSEDVLYCYRGNPQGASKGFEEKDFEYFNTKYVFELLEAFVLKKYSADDLLLKQLYARNFNETVYYILKFYRNAKTKERKKQVVEYDWNSFLLNEGLKHIKDNKYVRKAYIKVWKVFSKKAHFEICMRERFIGW